MAARTVAVPRAPPPWDYDVLRRAERGVTGKGNPRRAVEQDVVVAWSEFDQGIDGFDLGIKLSHQDLASTIGSTCETVTMGELQGQGLVRVSR